MKQIFLHCLSYKIANIKAQHLEFVNKKMKK